MNYSIQHSTFTIQHNNKVHIGKVVIRVNQLLSYRVLLLPYSPLGVGGLRGGKIKK